jgi:hypothetical protein
MRKLHGATRGRLILGTATLLALNNVIIPDLAPLGIAV